MADYPKLKIKGDEHTPNPEKIDVLPVLKDIITGAAKGNTTDVVGAPVDLLNTLINLPTAVFSKNSVDYGTDIPGGSETIRTLAGVEGKDKSIAETLGTNLSIGGLTKAMIVGLTRAQKAGKLVKDINQESINALNELGLLDNKELLNKFKVYVDSDNKAKTVVPDREAKVNYKFRELIKEGKAVSIDKIIDHPELFNMYPELRKLKVSQVQDPKDLGTFYPKQGRLELNPNIPNSEVKPTILHELQHAVQTIEKFTGGGNADKFRTEAKNLQNTISTIEGNTKIPKDQTNKILQGLQEKLNLAERQAFTKYENIPGEQEARFTQTFNRATEDDLLSILDTLIQQNKTPQTWQTQAIPTK